MKSTWWHVLASVGMGAFATVTPYIQGAIAGHPKLSVILAAAWGIFGGLLPSPVAKTGA